MRAILLLLSLVIAAPAQAAWWLELRAAGPLLANGEPAYVIEQQEQGGASGRVFADGDECMAEGRRLARQMSASTVDVICREGSAPVAFQDTPDEWLNGREAATASGKPAVTVTAPTHTIPSWLLARSD